MQPREFKKIYNKAKVWLNMDVSVALLSDTQLKSLAEALDITKQYTGLDMRQDFTLGVIKAVIKYGR